MRHASTFALLIAGIIHLLPLPGVLGVASLSRLYGIAPGDPDSAILLQHRALMFGALGALMLIAIGLPALRIPALALGLFSAASFIVVALWVGHYNAASGRVVVADIVPTALLIAGLAAQGWLIAHPSR